MTEEQYKRLMSLLRIGFAMIASLLFSLMIVILDEDFVFVSFSLPFFLIVNYLWERLLNF